MANLHVASELIKAVTNIIYPVGSIYISTNTANPSTYLGGTWSQVAKGLYLIGYDANNAWFNKPGQNKGSSNESGSWNTNDHTLTVDEMPKHRHDFNVSGRDLRWDAGLQAYGGLTSGDTVQFTWDNTTKFVGGGKGHSHFHVSPYYTVVVWKRTA